MKRLRLPLSLVLTAALVPAGAPAPASAAGAGASKRMAEKINAVRANHGLRPYRQSRRLRRSAAARARLMVRRNFFAHPSRLRVATFSRVGEVIALHAGRRARIGWTARRWMRSSGHRPLLLATHYRHVGAASATGRFNGRRVTIWVARFGRR